MSCSQQNVVQIMSVKKAGKSFCTGTSRKPVRKWPSSKELREASSKLIRGGLLLLALLLRLLCLHFTTGAKPPSRSVLEVLRSAKEPSSHCRKWPAQSGNPGAKVRVQRAWETHIQGWCEMLGTQRGETQFSAYSLPSSKGAARNKNRPKFLGF